MDRLATGLAVPAMSFFSIHSSYEIFQSQQEYQFITLKFPILTYVGMHCQFQTGSLGDASHCVVIECTSSAYFSPAADKVPFKLSHLWLATLTVQPDRKER